VPQQRSASEFYNITANITLITELLLVLLVLPMMPSIYPPAALKLETLK
jgi:hypothetical protein